MNDPGTPLQILATGAYLPAQKVSGEALDRRLGLPSGTTTRVSGVRARYFASQDDTNSRMAAEACRRVLAETDLEPGSIQAIVYAGGVCEQPIPCTASLIQRELGPAFAGCTCFDVNATCLGFVAGLDILRCMIGQGRFERVLLVTADIASAGLDWSHLESASLFGDGAVAAVIAKTPSGGGSRILASRTETYAEGADYCRIEGGGTRLPGSDYAPGADGVDRRFLFRMDGRKVFRMASEVIGCFVERLLEETGMDLREFDLVIPHQASLSGLNLMRRRLGLAESKFFTIVQDYGNLVATSIPLSLHLAAGQRRIHRGSKVLLIGTSAGFSIGGVALEY